MPEARRQETLANKAFEHGNDCIGEHDILDDLLPRLDVDRQQACQFGACERHSLRHTGLGFAYGPLGKHGLFENQGRKSLCVHVMPDASHWPDLLFDVLGMHVSRPRGVQHQSYHPIEFSPKNFFRQRRRNTAPQQIGTSLKKTGGRSLSDQTIIIPQGEH